MELTPFVPKSLAEVENVLLAYNALEIPKENIAQFASHLTQRPDAWFIQIGDVGLFYLTNIIPRFCADVQVVFWDRKFGRERRDVVETLVKQGFDEFELRRIQAKVPEPNRPLRVQFERMGFEVEGRLRNAWLDGETLQDLYVLSMVR